MSDLLNELPLVAILRGVTPARVEGVAAALFKRASAPSRCR